MDGYEAVCALGVTLHSHSHFSPSYTRGDVSHWAHCVAFYDFCERENSLEKKLRCGKAKKGADRYRQCARSE